MVYKLAMLLGLTGLWMVLIVDQTDSACCKPFKYNCRKTFWGKKCKTSCWDWTKPTPYCGYGPCNWFGCNCDGGCRSRKRAMAEPEEARSLLELLEGENVMSGRGYEDHNAAEELDVAEEARGLLELLRGEQDNTSPPEESDRAGPGFGHHDADQDMKLSKEEALEMLKKMEDVDISNLPDDWFESMDKDGNGYIEPEEYDKDTAKDLE